MKKPIVVGVDGSPGSRRAARWGAAEAAKRQTPLLLIHAFGVPDAFRGDVTPPQEWLEAQEKQAKAWLTQAIDLVERVHPHVELAAESFLDAPIPLLIEKSESAGMMVVGSTGWSPVGHLVMGSTAIALAAHGRCPVAIVRGRDEVGEQEPVVLGVDSAPLCEPAIELAFEEARLRRVLLIAVHAHARSEEVVPIDLSRWRAEYREVVLRQVEEQDGPRKQLLAWSRRAQLIVVGSRGRGGFAGLLLGSTSQALIHHADCPVVVARA